MAANKDNVEYCPAGIYLFKLTIEIIGQGVKYVQS